MKLLFEVELGCHTPTLRDDPQPERAIARMAQAIESAITDRVYVQYVNPFTLHQYTIRELTELSPWNLNEVKSLQVRARWIGVGVE